MKDRSHVFSTPWQYMPGFLVRDDLTNPHFKPNVTKLTFCNVY